MTNQELAQSLDVMAEELRTTLFKGTYNIVWATLKEASKQLKENDTEIQTLKDALRPFANECPFEFDRAAIPSKGIESAPNQVVANMSVGWVRILKAREALNEKGYRTSGL